MYPSSSPSPSLMGLAWGTALSDLSPGQTWTVLGPRLHTWQWGHCRAALGCTSSMTGAHRAQCWRFPFRLRMDQICLDIPRWEPDPSWVHKQHSLLRVTEQIPGLLRKLPHWEVEKQTSISPWEESRANPHLGSLNAYQPCLCDNYF